MSIRARLLTGMVILVALGLTAAAVVTYEEQRSFLLNRVDQQVQAALIPVAFQLRLDRARTGTSSPRPDRRFPFGGQLQGRPPGVGPGAALPPGTFGEIIGPTGTVLRRQTFSYGESSPPAPKLPTRLPLSRTGAKLKVVTVQATGGSGLRYRAVAFAVGKDTVIIAVPLREVDDTLHRLIVVEALVGAGVIVALVLLGWVVIRVGLRPLERIGRVASEIAGGDLSRRVTPSDQRTEVGRLGRSLNEMLVRIEQAFSARQASEDRLRRFLTDASHELRTPLASIRGYAELFRIGAADDPATLERAMTRIEAEATRMGVLVEDLLVLAALDQEPDRPQAPVDLAEVAEHAGQDTRVLAPERDVVVVTQEPLAVLGDADQLRQLVSNLMRNAIIHTPAGTRIELTVTAEGDAARIRVRDHGPGLPPGAGDQLFERFWRTEGGRSRGRGGAGLGLAIVQAIAHSHGGTVQAANAPDGGAVFDVLLPLTESPAPSQENLSVLTTDS
jgi:two-component system, OmpR family, sensor kinase